MPDLRIAPMLRQDVSWVFLTMNVVELDNSRSNCLANTMKRQDVVSFVQTRMWCSRMNQRRTCYHQTCSCCLQSARQGNEKCYANQRRDRHIYEPQQIQNHTLLFRLSLASSNTNRSVFDWQDGEYRALTCLSTRHASG